jgi:hypothetical protein
MLLGGEQVGVESKSKLFELWIVADFFGYEPREADTYKHRCDACEDNEWSDDLDLSLCVLSLAPLLLDSVAKVSG